MNRLHFTKEALVAYCVALGSCIAILIWLLRLWEADLGIPFCYSGDALLTGAFIKGIIDNGWYQANPYLGMPSGQLMYDFPQTCNLDFLIIKILSIFSSNYALVMNLYFLLTFPLTTLTAMYALGRLGIDAPKAIVGSLLFTFTPYHFLRGEGHLMLAAYYMLPLMIMVILWFYVPPPWPLPPEGRLKSIMKPSSLGALIICLLISSTFVYYPFFSCFFLLVAGLTSSWRWGEKERLGVALLLIFVICAGILINLGPTLLYHHLNGPNPEISMRNPGESELFGLKIIQLLLPIQDHRIPQLADIAELYTKASLVNENSFAALGIIAGAGFIILIFGSIFWCAGGGDDHVRMRGLSTLNLSAVLLATIGGFGTIFAALVTAQIRSYNRISIFIAFFSILALLMALEVVFDKLSSFRGKSPQYALLLLILMIGILDQSSPAFVPPSSIEEEFLTDEEFIGSVEELMPGGAMIFQLPYVPFPEHPSVMRMTDYEHFKAYLHSHSLRWSYGAIKGRDSDAWQRSVAKENLTNMVEAIYMAGFQGIYVDGYGYQDGGLAIAEELLDILGVQPLVSPEGRRFFFDLRNYGQNKRPPGRVSSGEIAEPLV